MNSKKLYPVIHCISPTEKGGIPHALANIKVARENGADGVFLIGHQVHFSDLCYIYDHVRKQHPEFWVGINFLDVSIRDNPKGVLRLLAGLEGINGYWTDELPHEPLFLSSVQVFAGVAFKYIDPNPSVEDLESACVQALKYSDVATTSGDKTGQAAKLEKLAHIRKKIGRMPLAVASGVSIENVLPMKPLVDIFMVASSITSRDPNRGNQEYLIPSKVRELADLIHA